MWYLSRDHGRGGFAQFLEWCSSQGTVFEPLRDQAIFAQVQVVMGAVQWTNGADLAPDAMYDAIKASGRWIVGVSKAHCLTTTAVNLAVLAAQSLLEHSLHFYCETGSCAHG